MTYVVECVVSVSLLAETGAKLRENRKTQTVMIYGPRLAGSQVASYKCPRAESDFLGDYNNY